MRFDFQVVDRTGTNGRLHFLSLTVPNAMNTTYPGLRRLLSLKSACSMTKSIVNTTIRNRMSRASSLTAYCQLEYSQVC